MYSAVIIARYIINKKFEEEKPINNAKLQSLLYLAQGQSYITTKEPLFEESICAWKQGPVVPDVYWMYAGYLTTNIRNHYDIRIDESTKSLIDDLLNRLDDFDDDTLKQIVCEKDSPWDKYYNEKQLTIIPEKQIRKYFLSFLS